MRALREFLITLALAVLIFVVIQATIQSFIVVGVSMKPSFEGGQRLLVVKAAYYFNEPQRGDVIVFQPLSDVHTDYIKRIIAVPGDTVEVKKGVVYLNGSELHEPYISSPPSYTLSERTISPDNYFVLGDNRNNSNDSHNGWLVPRKNIVGKAWLLIWPPGKWGPAPNYPLDGQLVSVVSDYLLGGVFK